MKVETAASGLGRGLILLVGAGSEPAPTAGVPTTAVTGVIATVAVITTAVVTAASFSQ